MNLGIIGLDSSHAVEFTRILNDPSQDFHIPGHPVTLAWPGIKSDDFDMSWQRIQPFTQQVSDYGVKIVDSLEQVAQQADALFLEQVDARKRLEQFERLAVFGKPVFVDKPFALSSRDSEKMLQLAQKHGCVLLSSSSLRYADGWTQAVKQCQNHITSANVYGPMPFTPTQPGYFWYGVHMADMLFAAFGSGCKWVCAESTQEQDVITAGWADGRLATIQGNRVQNPNFGGTLFTPDHQIFVDVSKDKRGYYEALVSNIIKMFDTKESPLTHSEMWEVTRFLEAANESRETGKKIYL